MDVSVNIDLTPVEARQLMGLPDVEPLQKAVLAKLEQKMMEQAEKFSAGPLLNSWIAGSSKGFDVFRDMAQGVFSQGVNKENPKENPKESPKIDP